jgi:hypothetical protein
MGTPREFLDHAQQCMKIAQGLKSRTDRALLVDMARAWVRIANRAELESMLLGERSDSGTERLH